MSCRTNLYRLRGVARMAFDREQYDAAVAKQAGEKTQQRLTALYPIRQAAVSASRLTGHDAWDSFVRILQAMIEQEQASKCHWQAVLTDPATNWDDASLANAKGQLVRADAKLEVLELTQDLPRQLIESGAQVDALIKQLESKCQAKRQNT